MDIRDILRRSRIVAKEEAPHIYAKLEELRTKAGLKHEFELIHCDHPLSNAMFAPTAFVGAATNKSVTVSPQKQYVFVTEGLLKSLDNPLHAPINAELETVLAHELSHAKHTGIELPVRFLPLILPIASVIGIAMHDHAKKTAERKKISEAAALDEIHHDAQTNFEPEPKSALPAHVQKSLSDRLLTVGKFVAAAIGSYAAALLIVRQSSLSAEFRADRFAAKLTGNGEALITALDKIQAHNLEVMKEQPPVEISKLRKLIMQCVHAHPSNEQRATAIRGL